MAAALGRDVLENGAQGIANCQVSICTHVRFCGGRRQASAAVLPDLPSACEEITMNGKTSSKAAGGDDRWSHPEAQPPARLQGNRAAPVATRCNTLRSGLGRDGWRIGSPSAPRALSSVASVSAEPGALVARALAILAEEVEASQARRGAIPPPQSSP
jgi:hypothetical protein